MLAPMSLFECYTEDSPTKNVQHFGTLLFIASLNHPEISPTSLQQIKLSDIICNCSKVQLDDSIDLEIKKRTLGQTR